MVLLRSNGHPAWRLTVAVPVTGAAIRYLQAQQRFCVNYGLRGQYNFDTPGHPQHVKSTDAHTEDRRRAVLITVTALGSGVAWAC